MASFGIFSNLGSCNVFMGPAPGPFLARPCPHLLGPSLAPVPGPGPCPGQPFLRLLTVWSVQSGAINFKFIGGLNPPLQAIRWKLSLIGSKLALEWPENVQIEFNVIMDKVEITMQLYCFRNFTCRCIIYLMFRLSEFCAPVVVVVATAEVEALALKNGVLFHDLLRCCRKTNWKVYF